MTYTIERVELLRAAIAVLPDKTEIREYLRGLYLNFETGEVVSTDGHRLLIAPLFDPQDGPRAPQILGFVGKNPTIPKSADRVLLDTDAGTFTVYRKSEVLAVHSYRVIVGQYPDYSRVVSSYNPRGAAVSDFGINPQYLADVQKALGVYGVKISPRVNADSIVKVEFGKDYLDLSYYIMPMRT